MKTVKKYALKYIFKYDTNEGKGFTQEEIIEASKKDGSIGAADALILINILREGKKAHDGSVSFSYMSFDGQHGEIPIKVPNSEIFAAWSALGKSLLDGGGLNKWQNDVLKTAFESVRKNVTQWMGKRNLD